MEILIWIAAVLVIAGVLAAALFLLFDRASRDGERSAQRDLWERVRRFRFRR